MRTAGLLILLAASTANATGTAPFTFKIPEGWTDLSPGAPEKNFDGLPDELRQDAQSGKFAVLAIDRRQPPGRQPNMSVVVESKPQDVNENFVSWYSVGVDDYMARQNPGLKIEFKERKLVKLNGVDCARFVYEIQTKDRRLKQLFYLMPGGPTTHAQVTYSAIDSVFDDNLDEFEASARATAGMAPTQDARKRTASALKWLGVAVGLMVVMAQIRRRRKRS